MFQVKGNFKKNAFMNINCPCCKNNVDDQLHLIQCQKLSVAKVSKEEYFTLFGNNTDKMKQMISRFEQIIHQRYDIIEDLKT